MKNDPDSRGAMVFVSKMFPLTLCLLKLDVMAKQSTLVDQTFSFQVSKNTCLGLTDASSFGISWYGIQ